MSGASWLARWALAGALWVSGGCSGDRAGASTRVAAGDSVASSAVATRSADAGGNGAPAEAPRAKEPSHEVRVDVRLRVANGNKRVFWLYTPEPLPERLGLVLVAPAGSNMVGGRALTVDDREEHMPYARAGFAVVAYSVDGALEGGMSDTAATAAITRYRTSRAGLANAEQALALAHEQWPTLEPELVFAAGRGSAGAHALLLAAEEPRVKGAIAFAPTTRLDDVATVVAVDRALSGFAKFVRWSLPENRVHDVAAPLFVFQSGGDEMVRASITDAYVEQLRAAGKTVEYARVADGDHVGASIGDGIPRAVAWLEKRRAR